MSAQNPKNQAVCTRCIMGRVDDPNITFDNVGTCHHCRNFDVAFAHIPKTEAESRKLLEPVIAALKKAGEGKPYDCLIGISGGVDSTYIALLMKRWGLRPLAVHFDNGWNSELAVQNIEQIIARLGFDLETYVIDWEDFRELQLAFLRASVIDIEMLTDHAIYGALFDLADRNGIKHIISGVNLATEGFLVESWIYDKFDHVNIKDIYRKHGSVKRLKNYPFVDYSRLRRIRRSGVSVVEILNLMVFDVKQARKEIEAELGWRPYDGKHHESIFTRFYQGYILPRKFGVDKRKAHLSNLVCSGQMTRQQALVAHQQEVYSPEQAADDLEFVCKKLKLPEQEFHDLMHLPPRAHLDFENHGWFFARHPMAKPLLPLWRRWQALRA